MIRIHNFRCSTICKINKIEIKQLSKNKKIIELELYRKYINKLLLKEINTNDSFKNFIIAKK